MTHPRVLAASARSISDVLIDAVRRRATSRVRLPQPSGMPADDDQLELPWADEADEPFMGALQFVRPDEIAVAALLGRALDKNRKALGGILDPGATTVIEVPGAEFVDVVDRLVRRHLADPASRITDGDALSTSDTTIVIPNSLVVFARDSSAKKNASVGNAEYACAVQRRFAVIGIATDAERTLPRDLVRLADHCLLVPPLDGNAIAAVIEAITGTRPGDIPAELGRHARLSDLTTAVRADLGAAGSLERLKRLTAGSDTSMVPALADLHGLGEAREWGLNLVSDLQAYMRKALPWAAVDKGCLLSGPPGTGKTTFARAISRSAGPDVHFIATSYSQWQSHKDGHLGNVTSAIRASFAEALQRRPCILFVDEIDAIPARGSTTRHDDWWTAILACLLECLDGVERREGVVIIGACNHPSRLDPALVRPGRLDKHICIPLPDTCDLVGILRVHLGGDLEGIDLMPAAVAARGGTGADVERWVRTARRVARVAQRPLALDDLVAAIKDGEPDLPADVRRRVAYHEAGHAVASIMLGIARPLSLSIHPSGGGVTRTQSAEPAAQTRLHLENNLILGMAGRAAEELVFGSLTAGAGGSEASDLAVVTNLALRMEISFGLGQFGPVWVGEEPDLRDLLLFPDLRKAVRQTLDKAHTAARQLLESNHASLDRLAETLFARGYLDRAEIDAAMAPPATATTVAPPAPALSPLPADESPALTVETAACE